MRTEPRCSFPDCPDPDSRGWMTVHEHCAMCKDEMTRCVRTYCHPWTIERRPLPVRCRVCGHETGQRPDTCHGDGEHDDEPIPEAEWTPWQRRYAEQPVERVGSEDGDLALIEEGERLMKVAANVPDEPKLAYAKAKAGYYSWLCENGDRLIELARRGAERSKG